MLSDITNMDPWIVNYKQISDFPTKHILGVQVGVQLPGAEEEA